MFVTYCDKRLICRCQCGCVCVGGRGGGGGKTFATCGIGQVLREVRMSWSSQHELVDATFRDIYEVEATGPLAILTTWQRLLAVACGSTSSTMRRLKLRSLSCLETILWASHGKWQRINASYHGLTELTAPVTLWMDSQKDVQKTRGVTFNVVF